MVRIKHCSSFTLKGVRCSLLPCCKYLKAEGKQICPNLCWIHCRYGARDKHKNILPKKCVMISGSYCDEKPKRRVQKPKQKQRVQKQHKRIQKRRVQKPKQKQRVQQPLRRSQKIPGRKRLRRLVEEPEPEKKIKETKLLNQFDKFKNSGKAFKAYFKRAWNEYYKNKGGKEKFASDLLKEIKLIGMRIKDGETKQVIMDGLVEKGYWDMDNESAEQFYEVAKSHKISKFRKEKFLDLEAGVATEK